MFDYLKPKFFSDMDLIFKYDFERLEVYSNETRNQNDIIINDQNNYISFLFPNVDYFNYSFRIDNKEFEYDNIKNIIKFYSDHNIKKHKIIIPSEFVNSKLILEQNFNYKYKNTIIKTCFPLYGTQILQHINKLDFIRIDEDNIFDFTNVYLDSFESIIIDKEKVSRNFRELLKLNNLELFLLNNGYQNVGVNVLYSDKNNYFLAGGAILPEFRNLNYHKSGLCFRINKCLSDPNINSIISWAYKDSISLRNMLKLNMLVIKEFLVYEFSK